MALLEYGEQQPNPLDAAKQYVNGDLDPTNLRALGSALAAMEYAAPVGLSSIYSDMTNNPLSTMQQHLQEQYDAFNQVSQSAKGFVGNLAADTGSLVGAIVNPTSLLPIGAAGELAGKGVSALLGYGVRSQVLPKLFESSVAQTLVKHVASGFVAGGAYSIPSAIASNYDAARNTIQWSGVAKQSMMGGLYGAAIGLTLPAISFAKSLLEKRKADNETVSPQEEDFLNNSDLNKETAAQANDIITEHNTNPNIQQKGANVDIPILTEDDFSNIQSAMVDMATNEGVIDAENTKPLFNSSKTFSAIMEDDSLLNTLGNVSSKLRNTADELSQQRESIFSKRKTVLINTLQRKLNLSDSVADSMKNMSHTEFNNLVNKSGWKEQVRQMGNLGVRANTHIAEMDELHNTAYREEQLQKTADTLDAMQDMRGTFPIEKDKADAKTDQYLKGRVEQSQEFPKTEKETNQKESVTQSKFSDNYLKDPRTVDEEIPEDSVQKDGKPLVSDIDKLKEALEKSKTNSKVFDKVLKCYMDNI